MVQVRRQPLTVKEYYKMAEVGFHISVDDIFFY